MRSAGTSSSASDTVVPGNTKASINYWKNIKDVVFRVNLDDVFYYSISFLSLIIAPLAAVAVFQSYYNITVSGLNCSSDGSTANTVGNGTDICTSTEPFHIQFTLFQRKDDFFYFKPHAGQSFCNSNPISTDIEEQLSNFLNTTELSTDVHNLFEGNIGECSEASLLSNEVFAFITMVISLVGVIWLTVISGRNSKTIKVQLVLSLSAMISSVLFLIIYTLLIDPSRSGVGPTFCEDQSLFKNCNESSGSGLYCQIAVAILSFLTSLICAVALKFDTDTSGKTFLCCGKDDDDDDDDDDGIDNNDTPEVDEEVNQQETQEEQPSQETQHNKHESDSSSAYPILHTRRHLLIKFGRFLEFFLSMLAFSLHFTKLELLYPDEDASIEIYTYLWSFDKHGWSFCYNPNSILDGTYGYCVPHQLLEVYAGFIKVIISGGLALFMKHDAKRNPMFYLGGILFDILTILFVSVAIHRFYKDIYPGRSDIDPSVCEQLSSVSVINGVSYGGSDDCNISLGSGFWTLCVVLVITVLNFVTEFIHNEIGQEYGAINAFKTVFKRLRKGRMRSAILGPASIYEISEETLQQVDDDNVRENETVEFGNQEEA